MIQFQRTEGLYEREARKQREAKRNLCILTILLTILSMVIEHAGK